jgi:hypothetical protein
LRIKGLRLQRRAPEIDRAHRVPVPHLAKPVVNPRADTVRELDAAFLKGLANICERPAIEVRFPASKSASVEPDGVTDFGSQALAQRNGKLLNGVGKSLAETLYAPDELAKMRSFASALRAVTLKKGAAPNSDTAPALGVMSGQ